MNTWVGRMACQQRKPAEEQTYTAASEPIRAPSITSTRSVARLECEKGLVTEGGPGGAGCIMHALVGSNT
jgi:hypothetical protein